MCFDTGLVKTYKYDFPVISVGNLSTGGTGKTPVVEYLADLLLKNNFKIAILSRGYRRKTKGYVLAKEGMIAEDIGDEPFQMKLKFSDAHVAVCEKRVTGINELKKNFPDLDAIILDDAFQHRSVMPGLSILLSDHYKPYYNDWVLPSGNLREAACNMKRADVILVTKSPQDITEEQAGKIKISLACKPSQKVFFTHINYEALKSFNSPSIFLFDVTNAASYSVLLFAGISNITPLKNYIESVYKEVICMKFADHHYFTFQDVDNITLQFNKMEKTNKIIITTEKDIARIKNSNIDSKFQDLPLYFIPISVSFNNRGNNDIKEFDHKILTYVRENKRNV
jgi:tetraacyldisaccharide 4'-kinase